MTASCGTCRHARPDAGNPAGNVLYCHRYPPAAHPLVMPVPPDVRNPHGSVGIQVLRTRPNVTPDDGCGEWSHAPGGTPPLTLIK